MDSKKAIFEVGKLCGQLDRITADLAKRRRIFLYMIILHFGLINFIVISILINFSSKFFYHGNVILGCVLSTSLLLLLLNPRHGKAFKQYNRSMRLGRKILAELIKIVDWTGLRKQQLYKGNNPKAEKSILRYYNETQHWLSPIRQGINYYFAITRALLIIDVALFFFAIIVILKNDITTLLSR